MSQKRARHPQGCPGTFLGGFPNFFATFRSKILQNPQLNFYEEPLIFYNSKLYNQKIINPNVLKPKEGLYNYHVYHLYVIRLKKRNKLLKYLKENKIFSGIHYKLPVHKQIAYNYIKKRDLKITEKISKEVISLPVYPGLKLINQKKVIKLINIFL